MAKRRTAKKQQPKPPAPKPKPAVESDDEGQNGTVETSVKEAKAPELTQEQQMAIIEERNHAAEKNAMPINTLTTESIQVKEDRPQPPQKNKPPMLHTGSIVTKEEQPVMEMLNIPPEVEITHYHDRKYKKGELGKQTRRVIKVQDRNADHNIEMGLDNGKIYVLEFRNGEAAIPQEVAVYIQQTFPKSKFYIVP